MIHTSKMFIIVNNKFLIKNLQIINIITQINKYVNISTYTNTLSKIIGVSFS